MHRNQLKTLLSQYQTSSDEDKNILKKTVDFVENNIDCCERSLSIGHITGSAWIVDRKREYALFTFHRKLDRWLQLGGHCDGNTDVYSVALTEAKEESGLTNIKPISSDIFDIDIHTIPEYKNIPEHDHYDIRFIFEADINEELQISHESKNLSWIKIVDIDKYTKEPSVIKMVKRMHLMTISSS